ncbi:MAG: 5-(carboxyamino)imidazole ribonucleotide synthase [Beijerinckiaceae bacterium]
MTDKVLQPGDTIGILGGGQLGRMIAMAAARLGINCHIYAPEPNNPAYDVAAKHTVGSYEDEAALKQFAASVACVTYEFENVPARTVEILSARVPVRPGAKALAVCQDRVAEKELARKLGARTATFAEINSLDDLTAQVAIIGTPSILKTRRFGYDGKGQFVLRKPDDVAAAWAAVAGSPCILERFVPFQREVSVVAARGLNGAIKAFPVTENEHREQILRRSSVPATIHPETARDAIEIAGRIATALDYVGVMAVEFFVSVEDGVEKLYVNEMAPRVHNSGHWTLDGADTSQFEQHVRAIAGLPLGSVAQRSRQIEMINLIGADMDKWQAYLAEPGTQLHLYGKGEARPGRKMGHLTRVVRG